MMLATRFLHTLILLLGTLLMTSSQAAEGTPAAPMSGPDFVMEKVASWVEHPDGNSLLILRDGSRWRLEQRRRDYGVQRDFIVRAIQTDSELFVSGNRSQGVVDRTALPRKLAVQKLGATELNGRYRVLFHGPPSIYYLRTERPWAAQALALLERSNASGAFIDSPDLLVAIDTVTSEIMAVRPLK